MPPLRGGGTDAVVDRAENPDAGSLDRLLWPDGVATMHDAILLELTIDFAAATIALALRVDVSDPDSGYSDERDARRAGTLRIGGLEALSIEPPDQTWRPGRNEGLWIDAGLGDPSGHAPADRAGARVAALDARIRFWLYAHEWNSFVRLTCSELAFEWADAAERRG